MGFLLSPRSVWLQPLSVGTCLPVTTWKANTREMGQFLKFTKPRAVAALAYRLAVGMAEPSQRSIKALAFCGCIRLSAPTAFGLAPTALRKCGHGGLAPGRRTWVLRNIKTVSCETSSGNSVEVPTRYLNVGRQGRPRAD
jgi:hypothetical protein